MSDIGKIIRVNALPSPDKRENNVIYQVAAPGAATYKDYAIDSSGDLKTPSYIPLTGTEEGKPLTKNIEVDPSEEGSVGLISNTPDVSEAVLVIQENDSILAESSNSSENNSSSIHIHYDDGIEISATTSDEQFSAIIDTSGLKGDHYIPPTSDEHYVQKKFVADNFTSQPALNSTLANYYTKPETYSKAEVDAKLSAVYRPKGSVANFASLPSSGNTEGDVWNVLDTGSNYVWVINLNNTGVAGWDKLSETVDLTNYITLNTEQTITGRKMFSGSIGNTFDTLGLEVRGNGSTDTIYPGISFHQPGLYAASMYYNSAGFHFRNINNTGYDNIYANSFHKSGSDDSYVLTGGGGHKSISDFALSSQLGNYVSQSGDTMTGTLNARNISAQNGTDKLTYDNIENYGSPLKINANASLGVYLQANSNNMLYVGPSYSEFLNDLYITPGKVISNYNTDSNQWGRAYTHGLVDRNEAFVSNSDVNNIGNQSSQIISIELGNGSGNSNFPFYTYGNFLKMSSRSFTSEFAHQTGGALYHRNWYLADSPQNTPFRKVWDDFNLPNPATQNDLSTYVPISGDLNVWGIKTFTGDYTQWLKDGDSSVNARGIIGSRNTNFDIGTINNKNVAIYRNSVPKIIIEDTLTRINNDIYMSGGGIVYSNGDVEHKQTNIAPNATGAIWKNKDGSGNRIAGIGVLTNDGDYQYNYIGWGNTPWEASNCLAVAPNTFLYKGNDIWHSGNLEDYHQYGLGTVVEVGATDMDIIPQTSVLGINDGTANRPAGVGYGSVWTHRKSATEFTQLATEIFSGQLFTRAKSDAGGFTPWRKQWDSVNLPNPVNQSDLGNYLTYTGATQNLNLNTKRLLNVGNPLDYYIESIQAGGKIASYGNENNSVKTFVSSVTLDSIVAGHTFDFYNTSWKVGNKRGGSANSLGFSFEFSNDGGADYNGVATIGTNGIVYSSGFNAPVFTSPNLIGGQVFYAGNSDQLYFGNPSVGAVYHEAGSLHAFSAGGNYPLYINSGGIAVNGGLSINGQDAATQSWTTSNFIPLTQKGIANGIATLDTNGLISTTQLPSYVDDVLEFTNLASFPATGESGKIYVALNTNKTYRWSGSSYIYITSGTVDSVNGQTGIVNLSKSDIGLSNIDNTADATKNVLSATKWTTPRTLSYTGDVTGSASVDGSGNVNFAMTLANSGVSAGTYNSVNVDAKGRVLSGNHINYATESYVADLLQQNYFDQTVADERFVNTEGDETINGNKTFSSSPSIPAATNGEHAVNLEQLTASLSNVVYDNDDFEILEVYRLIDSNHFDLDDTRIKKYNIVFDGTSNGSVNITHLRDNQYYQFSNVSGSGADLRVGVEGYGMVDVVSSGKTAVYMSWGDGKLLKISENTNVSII